MSVWRSRTHSIIVHAFTLSPKLQCPMLAEHTQHHRSHLAAHSYQYLSFNIDVTTTDALRRLASCRNCSLADPFRSLILLKELTVAVAVVSGRKCPPNHDSPRRCLDRFEDLTTFHQWTTKVFAGTRKCSGVAVRRISEVANP